MSINLTQGFNASATPDIGLVHAHFWNEQLIVYLLIIIAFCQVIRVAYLLYKEIERIYDTV